MRSEMTGAVVPLTWIVQLVKIFVVVVGVGLGVKAGAVCVCEGPVGVHKDVASLVGSCC